MLMLGIQRKKITVVAGLIGLQLKNQEKKNLEKLNKKRKEKVEYTIHIRNIKRERERNY